MGVKVFVLPAWPVSPIPEARGWRADFVHRSLQPSHWWHFICDWFLKSVYNYKNPCCFFQSLLFLCVFSMHNHFGNTRHLSVLSGPTEVRPKSDPRIIPSKLLYVTTRHDCIRRYYMPVEYLPPKHPKTFETKQNNWKSEEQTMIPPKIVNLICSPFFFTQMLFPFSPPNRPKIPAQSQWKQQGVGRAEQECLTVKDFTPEVPEQRLRFLEGEGFEEAQEEGFL